MNLEPWHYFLSLEQTYMQTTDFVEPCEANFSAYSNRFAALLLSLGSEVDVIARRLCSTIDPDYHSIKKPDIMYFRSTLTARFNGIHGIEIGVGGYKLAFQPWIAWSASKPTSPDWWRAYNEIKHDRLAKVERANLENVLNALCGLMSLHLYLYRDDNLQPFSKLLQYGWPAFLVEKSRKLPPGV